ncbi:MAG TPA: YihY/virulence factor BrkB family protein [Polyangiaceae bacterium]|jgi:membrane protein
MRELLHDTWSTFSRRRGTLLGGALAFYAMLSVAPLLVIAIYVAGFVTSESLARTALLENISQYVGPSGAATIGGLMERVMRPGAGWRGVVAGLVLVYASTRLFNELESALDHLWSLPEPETTSFLKRLGEFVLRRMLKFGLVLATGLVLVVLVVLKLGYDAVGAKLGFVTPMGWRLVQASISTLVCTVLFALLFRHLTPARFPMRQALLGGGITAALFSAGAWAISAYLSRAPSLAATYGDAASIVLLLLWVHYSAQIFLLGAAFTGEWVKRHGGFQIDSKRST